VVLRSRGAVATTKPPIDLREAAEAVRETNVAPLPLDESAPSGGSEDVLQYLDSLYNFARHLTGDSVVAEDLVQDTYARALAAHATFMPGTNRRAWLFRILRNAFIDGRRTARRADFVEGDADDHGSERAAWAREPLRGDPEMEALRGVVGASIERALTALSADARAVVLLDLEGFTETEVAQIVGCPVGTVKSRLMRARHALRLELAEYRR